MSEQQQNNNNNNNNNDVGDDFVTISTKDGKEILNVPVHVLEKIPFFHSLMSGRWNNSNTKEATNKVLSADLEYKLLYPCISYAQSGYKEHSLLLTKLSRSVCGTMLNDLLTMLCIDIPIVNDYESLSLLEINLRRIKNETNYISKRKIQFYQCDRIGARNSAVIFYFSVVKGTVTGTLDITDQRIRQKIMTDVLFIISHAKTFGPQIRTHIWKFFNTLVTLKKKQISLFERWITPYSLSYEVYRNGDNNNNNVDDDNDTDGSMTDGFEEEDVISRNMSHDS